MEKLELQRLRRSKDYLKKNNGIKDLKTLYPEEIEEAKRVFDQDGFVVIKNALKKQELKKLKKGCEEVIREILALDKGRVGNRGHIVTLFGSSSISGHLMHRPEWAMLLDLPTITPILKAIFYSSEYIARGGGGDFCLPGATEYQLFIQIWVTDENFPVLLLVLFVMIGAN
ncbi:MAG: hypothetical protein Ct9H300mP20_13230 [Gammaproteobacteria bacterium]|nr:MAG: hypothetical protein Ct9H300mP20_13230 [Gammaproteobacteria bacterium]